MKQRQPVLLSGVLAACADRLVERIIVGDRAERRDIARAEAADRLGVERGFGRGKQRHLILRAAGALGFGVEAADGFELRAEEVEPERLLGARRPEIENAASRRVFARLAHRAGTRIRIARKKANQLLERDLGAHLGEEARICDGFARRHALNESIDRGDHECRSALVGALCKCGQCGEPAALDVRAR